jgi:hypothetical protein
MTPSGTRGVLNDALSIYFADATLASAFVARWCVGAKVETAGGVFQVREDEPEPRVERAFGADVDYGQEVKAYEAEPVGRGRYSPPHVTAAQRIIITGNPEKALISTSLVERQNLTMRMSMRRFTRLTNAFSKKVENLRAAVSLHCYTSRLQFRESAPDLARHASDGSAGE